MTTDLIIRVNVRTTTTIPGNTCTWGVRAAYSASYVSLRSGSCRVKGCCNVTALKGPKNEGI